MSAWLSALVCITDSSWTSRGPKNANRRRASFHDQDRTVRELYNSIGPAAYQSIVER